MFVIIFIITTESKSTLACINSLFQSFIYILCVRLDPGSVAGHAGVDTGEGSLSAANAERADTNNDTVVVKRTAGVTLALVTTTTCPAGAQHVVGDTDTSESVVVSASILINNAKLDVTELLRGGATRL